MLYVKCYGQALSLTYQATIKCPQVTYKTLNCSQNCQSRDDERSLHKKKQSDTTDPKEIMTDT